MKAARMFLLVNGMIWLVYSLSVTFYPQIFADLTGLAMQKVIQVEIVAMYGGLQLALGVYSLLGALIPRLVIPNLILWSLVLTCLATFRLLALWSTETLFTLNFGEWGPGGYNEGALWFFELPFALFAIILLVKIKDSTVATRLML